MRKLFSKKTFDLEACIAASFEGLQLVNQTHRDNWRLGQEQSWKVDEHSGSIQFTFADGAVVSAPVQVIGTYHAAEQSFQWAWDHPSVPPKLRLHTAKVKAFGQANTCQELTKGKTPCTEKRAWEYTALAMLLAEANGAYRARIAADTYAFMTFGAVTTTAASTLP